MLRRFGFRLGWYTERAECWVDNPQSKSWILARRQILLDPELRVTDYWSHVGVTQELYLQVSVQEASQ